jgi:reactive intermediate/imine deaminase
MKKLILISALLLSFNGWAEDIVVEHFSSEQTIKQDFPFSDAVKVGNTLYLSGMIGEDEEGNLVEGGIVPEAHNVMKRMGTLLAHYNLGYDDVVKCLVMIDDISQWSLFNSVYVQYFEKPYPARSAFGADGLAGNASFELECIAHIQMTTK